MIDLRLIPVVRVLVPFTGGSLAGYLGGISFTAWEMVIPGLLMWTVLLLLYYLSRRKTGISRGFFSLLVFGLFSWAGLGTGILGRPEDPGLPVGEPIMISGTILEGPWERGGRYQFEMRLQGVDTGDTVYRSRTLIKAYMTMPADSVFPVPGEFWRLGGRLAAIRNNGNPGETDYANILKRKNCWYRFYCDAFWERNARMDQSRSVFVSAIRIRKVIADQWMGPPEVVSLLKAVCLGDRSGLSEEMRDSYSMAGGMHVLAVSGLHVGLIWWVLHHAFSFLVRLLKREFYRVVLITLLLWFYAYVTGFSSSVCRSVTMFTIFTVTRLTGQRGHPVNAILVSMFFLILIRPGRLLDVGFQLSYAAVLAIVIMHPVLKGLIRIRNRLLNWVWEATIVSVAAQIGTMPLVIHYFHRVPVYGLLTNLAAIPLLSCIMVLFIVSIPFIAMGAGILNRLLMSLGGMMNSSMEVIASLPGSSVGNLYMAPVCSLLLVWFIFLIMAILRRRRGIPVFLAMLTLCGILLNSSFIRYSRLHSSQVSVSRFKRSSMITFRVGMQVDHYIWCADSSSMNSIDRYLASAWGNRCYESHVMQIQGNSRIDTLYRGNLFPGVTMKHK